MELEEHITTLKKEVKDEVREKVEAEERICRLQSSYEKEKTDLEEHAKDLQSAKDLLLNSKVQLQNKLEDANLRTNILKQEIEKVKMQSQNTEDQLQSEIKTIKNELVRKSLRLTSFC